MDAEGRELFGVVDGSSSRTQPDQVSVIGVSAIERLSWLHPFLISPELFGDERILFHGGDPLGNRDRSARSAVPREHTMRVELSENDARKRHLERSEAMLSGRD